MILPPPPFSAFLRVSALIPPFSLRLRLCLFARLRLSPALFRQRRRRESPEPVALDNATVRAQPDPASMWKKQQREKLKTARFPANWSRVLEERFPLYARLPVEDRKELQAHIQVFLAEKRFEGCGGLEITDEMSMDPQTPQSSLP